MNISKYAPLVYDALDYMQTRQKIISSNIANIDTPFYQAKDIDFENLLAFEAEKLDHKNRDVLKKTNPKHMEPNYDEDLPSAKIFFRGTHTTKNDGNDVDLDVEMSQMSKNTISYNALISAYKKRSLLFKSILDASSKV